ncbi:MAG: SPOR domain-containing protein [Bacteroidales bacterium]|nr:SPOR domain-containing protein [Bacteroidales bacterium]
MKTLQIILALSAPALLAAGFMPEEVNNYNALNISNIQIVHSDDDGFRLCKQGYYREMFNEKELSKLDKAEKYRTKAEEASVLAVAIQKQSDDLKIISGQSAKIQKQSAKLAAKAASQELTALKTFEKAASLYRPVYFDKIMQLSKDTSQMSLRTARSMSERAYQLYHTADSIKAHITSENTLEANRAIYTNLVNAVHYQELALAVCKGDPKIDYTQYIDIHKQFAPDTTKKVDIPKLVAFEHYDFDKDSNLYKLRYHELAPKLGLTDADRQKIDKISLDEAAIANYYATAVEKGSEADTFRVYSNVENKAVHEYYEQMAQESELSECSNLLRAITLATANNNVLYEIYKKYIPAFRIQKNNVGTYMDKSALGERWERNAEDLYNMSKTYEEMAAKQLSNVEKYTLLSEGNEAKLQALQYMENAIALYLDEKPERERRSLVSAAVERHNDIAMDFMMDESGETDAKPATNTTPKDTKPANQVVDVAGNNKTTGTKTNPATGSKTTNTTTGSKTNTTSGSTGKASSTTTATPAKNTASKTHTPDVASSNAAVIGTFNYTRDDQRMKPYTFPQGTVFSVEAGIYKEMVEPVDFPTISNFLAQNLKGITPMRYYIGTFQTYDAALAASSLAKNEGYKNAQVVAFTNGKKVDLTAARKVAEKTTNYQANVQKELKTLNAGLGGNTPIVVDNSVKRTGDALPLSMLGSTVYAVQIAALPTLQGMGTFNVNELYYDQNNAGLYRYYTGISNDRNITAANLNTLKQSGYTDAYVVKIVNGQNIGRPTGDDNIDNIVKGTVYRVQIGAFVGNPNPDTQKRINNLKTKGYTVHTSQSGKYTVYTVGDCPTREQAETLKKNLAGQGFKDGYVATFVNGVKKN